jgi:flagellar basal-body rod protein FlgC
MRFSFGIFLLVLTLNMPAFAQDELFKTMTISAYGMKAQGERTRVISENIANATTTALTPDGQPYTRKLILFENDRDKTHKTDLVKVKDITDDRKTDYTLKYMPDHPGANAAGYVKMPNVNMLVEMNDMREAQRSYEANLGMLEQSKTMSMRTIDLLR